jgi:hypothetical protein
MAELPSLLNKQQFIATNKLFLFFSDLHIPSPGIIFPSLLPARDVDLRSIRTQWSVRAVYTDWSSLGPTLCCFPIHVFTK